MAVESVLLAVMLALTWYGGKALRFNREDRIAIQFAGSKKSLAAGLPMASVLFGAHASLAVLPLMLFHQMQLMVCAVIAERRSRDPLTESELASGSPAGPAPRHGRYSDTFRLSRGPGEAVGARARADLTGPRQKNRMSGDRLTAGGHLVHGQPQHRAARGGGRIRGRRHGRRGQFRRAQRPVPDPHIVDRTGEVLEAVHPLADVHPNAEVRLTDPVTSATLTAVPSTNRVNCPPPRRSAT